MTAGGDLGGRSRWNGGSCPAGESRHCAARREGPGRAERVTASQSREPARPADPANSLRASPVLRPAPPGASPPQPREPGSDRPTDGLVVNAHNAASLWHHGQAETTEGEEGRERHRNHPGSRGTAGTSQSHPAMEPWVRKGRQAHDRLVPTSVPAEGLTVLAVRAPSPSAPWPPWVRHRPRPRRCRVTSTPRRARPAWPRTARPGPCTPPTTARCTRCGARPTTPPRTSARSARAGSPTRRRRTPSAPAPPASSPRSTTSPATATTSPTRPRAARPAGRTTSRTRPRRRSRSTATRSTASTSPPAPATATTAPRASRPATPPRASTRSSTAPTTNNGCCFDYGNAETNNDDNGAGHMEAIYFGTEKAWGHGSGNGPWIMADMENGLFSGRARA